MRWCVCMWDRAKFVWLYTELKCLCSQSHRQIFPRQYNKIALFSRDHRQSHSIRYAMLKLIMERWFVHWNSHNIIQHRITRFGYCCRCFCSVIFLLLLPPPLLLLLLLMFAYIVRICSTHYNTPTHLVWMIQEHTSFPISITHKHIDRHSKSMFSPRMSIVTFIW